MNRTFKLTFVILSPHFMCSESLTLIQARFLPLKLKKYNRMNRKLLFTFLGVSLFCFSSYSQAPQSFKYQSAARNSTGDAMINTNIGLRINIRNLSATGPILYQETHAVTTNAVGLFSIS